MPYLGKQAEEGGALIRSHEFLQGTDTSTGTSAFTVASTGGDYVRVFLNGVLLQEGASNDYTKTTSAVTITGTAPADGDILKIDIYESITIWDTVSASNGGTFSAGITGTTVDATTDFTVGGTVITDNTITDDGTLVIASTTATSFSDGNITNVGSIALDSIVADGTSITLSSDTALSAGKDLETSTTGKVKQKGAFMQSSTHQAMVLGG